jgi:RIP metalloprotease RseP
MIQVAQILFILSVLVILHEFGHYITAKMFKMRVEKFYLFMDVGFSLIKKKIGETEWGIGWLPLGGYVKISGMIDESMDADQMKQEPQPWEFRSKPAWQRLIVMLGGIIVNILLAIFIYSLTFSTTGQKTISTEKIQKNGLAFGEVGNKVGFKNGDKIISIDGKEYNDFKFVAMSVLFGDKVEIERAGKKLELQLSDEQKGEIIKKEGKGFVGARFSVNNFFIDSIGQNNNGILRFDEIIGANDKKFTYIDELFDVLRNKEADSVSFLIKRDNQELVIKTKVDSTGKKGLSLKSILLSENFELNNAVIGEIAKDSEAEKSGVEFDDKIIEINNKKIIDYKDFKKQISFIKPNSSLKLKIERENKVIELDSKVNKKGKIGIGLKDNTENEFIVRNKMSIGQAIPEACALTWNMFKYNINSFKLILRPKTGAYAQVKSPIGIARQLPEKWDWEFIWNFTALFSIGLAFMNLLPIPGLDGGHALFTIVEMVTGKKLSDKAAGYVQTGGMIFLLSLMVLTFGKDIYQLILDKLIN